MSESIDEGALDRLAKAKEEGLAVKRQGLVKQAIIIELQEKAKEALRLKRLRDEAKTKPKREHYTKKLKKNSEDVPELVEALQRLTDIEEAKRGQALNEERNVEGEGLEVQETSGPDSAGGVIVGTSDGR